MSENLVPARSITPGRILSRELEARGWTQKDLAEVMGRPHQTINEIVRGSKQITPETALELEAALGPSAEFWTNLETNYRLSLARKEGDEKTIARRSCLYQLLPMPELIKRHWLPETDSIDELETYVCHFLGIASLNHHFNLAVNFRCTTSQETETNAQIAWVARAKYLANQQTVARFDRVKLASALPVILAYAADAKEVAQVPKLLMNLGVHFVIVPHLPKTRLDGAAFYLDETPVVALTLRYDRIDAFWFNLMHELAHIVSEHQGIILDNMEDGDINEQEREANQKARDWLIDPHAFESFVQTAAPTFPKAKIEQFAASQGRHPGIVLGRVQREYKGYQYLRKLLVPVKTYLEDWIDVPAPNGLT